MTQTTKAAPGSVREHRSSQGPRHDANCEGVIVTEDQSTQTTPAYAATWTCESCGFPISADAGCLGVPFEDLSDSDNLRWRALHYDCITPEREVYGVPLADLTTARGVARWTHHLMEKNWLPYVSFFVGFESCISLHFEDLAHV